MKRQVVLALTGFALGIAFWTANADSEQRFSLADGRGSSRASAELGTTAIAGREIGQMAQNAAGGQAAAPYQAAGAPETAISSTPRVALVIGIGGYKFLPRLDNPPSDARLVAATLKELGFKLVGDTAQTDLDRTGFEQAIREFGRMLKGGGVGLFYYAGHGVQIRDVNYLIPVGANPASAADADFEMIDTSLVLKQMEAAGSKLNFMILDACRNNPFGGRGLRASGGGLAQMRAPSGTLISYATQPGNVAADGSDGHSPYTRALVDAMKRPGLRVLDVFNAVGLAVDKESQGRQQPWVSTSPLDGDFYFAPPIQAAMVVPGPAPGPGPAPMPDTEVVFWESIMRSSNPADFKAYLAQYPEGRFAPLAQIRLAALQPPLPPPAPLPDKQGVAPPPAQPSEPTKVSLGPGESRSRSKPDIEGRVKAIASGSRFIVGDHWIDLYGIEDPSANLAHRDALKGFLMPTKGMVECYQKGGGKYQCFVGDKDLAELVLRGGVARPAAEAPSEYRSLVK
jgi:hypothetical protein